MKKQPFKCRHPRAKEWGRICPDGFEPGECLQCPEQKKLKVGYQWDSGDSVREITDVGIETVEWANLSSAHCERHRQGIPSFLKWIRKTNARKIRKVK